MALEKILITNKDSMTLKHVAYRQPYEYDKYEVSTAEQANKTVVAIYDIMPGKSNYPYHYHISNEEVFYIISGQGMLETPDGEIAVSTGDVIIFPPCEKGAHKLTNTSDSEMLTYIDVDVNNSPDLVFYPHSNKVGVFTHGEFKKLYKSDSNVGYYEDE